MPATHALPDPEADAPSDAPPPTYTSFDGPRRIAAGPLHAVALVVKRALQRGAAGPVLTFDDRSGRVHDIDTRGSEEEVLARLPQLAPAAADAARAAGGEPAGPEPRGRGRPRLGVVAREVTLLPRHWDWLGAQPGGASVALRRLVERARREFAAQDRRRQAQERGYAFMSTMAGHLPGFEEASRALFAPDRSRFLEHARGWPQDVREHVLKLGFVEDVETGT